MTEYLLQHRFDELEKNNAVRILDELFFKIVTEIAHCDFFLEAGAFEGDASYNLSKMMPMCSVYALEANPYNYEHFKDKFLNTNVNYINIALSDNLSPVTFKIQRIIRGEQINAVGGTNSILPRSHKDVEYEDVTVDATTIDSLVPENKNSVCMWLDLEGFAFNVLQSSVSTLKRTACIKIEVEEHQFWEDQKLANDIINFLLQFNIVPVIRDFERPTQYNILFCNLNLISTESILALEGSIFP